MAEPSVRLHGNRIAVFSDIHSNYYALQACYDDAEQTALYKEAAALLTTTAANIYVQDMADFLLLKTGVEGYQFYPMYVMDLATVYYVQ